MGDEFLKPTKKAGVVEGGGATGDAAAHSEGSPSPSPRHPMVREKGWTALTVSQAGRWKAFSQHEDAGLDRES